MAQPAPHGGQVTVAGALRFEAVYSPQEMRLYLYDAQQRPISAQGVRGRVALKVRGYDKVYRYPLQYVAPRAGAPSHDCLAVAVNSSRIKDGDMSVTFELAYLPDRQRPQAAFTQTFALTKTGPQVTVVALTAADSPGIAQQKVCPVLGGKLGSMGAPVKVLVGGQPVYLCCKGCIGKVQANPEAYLPKTTAPPTQPVWTCSMHPQVRLAKQGKCPICSMNLIPLSSASAGSANAAAPRTQAAAPARGTTVTTATAADQAAIRAQRLCAVANSPLGGMGTPIKVTINGQVLFLCCKGCLAKVKKNPQQYLAKAAQLRAGR